MAVDATAGWGQPDNAVHGSQLPAPRSAIGVPRGQPELKPRPRQGRSSNPPQEAESEDEQDSNAAAN